MVKKILLAFLLTLAMNSSYAMHTPSFYQAPTPPASYGRSLGIGEHQIIGFSSDGTIEIQNLAKFRVHPSDTYDVKYWNIGEHITFHPNSSPFSSSDFYVTNKDRDETIRANLWGGPFYDHPATDRIDQIDFLNNEVVLVNGHNYRTRWAIDPSDMHLLKACQRGETALIGINNNWFSWLLSSAPNVLVSYENTEFFAYVRCTPKPY